MSGFPRFDVSVERLTLYFQIVSEHLDEIFSFADFRGFDGRRAAKRDDFVAQVLRMHVRLGARRGEKWGELLALLAGHKALLLKILDGRSVFQGKRAVQTFDQIIAIV